MSYVDYIPEVGEAMMEAIESGEATCLDDDYDDLAFDSNELADPLGDLESLYFNDDDYYDYD